MEKIRLYLNISGKNLSVLVDLDAINFIKVTKAFDQEDMLDLKGYIELNIKNSKEIIKVKLDNNLYETSDFMLLKKVFEDLEDKIIKNTAFVKIGEYSYINSKNLKNYKFAKNRKFPKVEIEFNDNSIHSFSIENKKLFKNKLNYIYCEEICDINIFN